MRQITGGTLFSGIGAPELSAPWIKWRWCAEIDPFAGAILETRFPRMPNLADVTKANWDAVEPVDLIVFGSPCQSFSVAGKRAGLDDARGNMALIGLQVVNRIRPHWVVFENVPGLLSSDEGRDFGAFLGFLGECGYGFAYRVLDAQYAGVPQRRRRVFVVGYLGDWRPAAAVLFESESLRGDTAPSRETGERPTGSLSSRATAGGGLTVGALAANGATERKHGFGMGQQDWESGYAIPVAYGIDSDCLDRSGEGAGATAAQRSGLGITAGFTNALRAKRSGAVAALDSCSAGRVTEDGTGRGCPIVTHSLRADGFDASEDGTGRGTPLIAAPLSVGGDRIGQKGYAGRRQEDDTNIVAFQSSQSGMRVGDQHPTLDSHNGSRRHHGALQAMSVRRLTPRECERLQGFPDDFTLIEFRGKPAADGPRYRTLGNSMAVPVIGWILRRVLEFETHPISSDG